MMLLFIWLLVGLDRYVEFELEHPELRADTGYRLTIMVIALAWPITMPIRIIAWLFRRLTGKI